MLQLRAVMLQSGRAKEMFKRIKMSIDGGMHVERYIHVRTSTSSMADCALWTVDDWPLFVVCQSVWALLHNYGVDWDTGIAEVGNIMGELETYIKTALLFCQVFFCSIHPALLYIGYTVDKNQHVVRKSSQRDTSSFASPQGWLKGPWHLIDIRFLCLSMLSTFSMLPIVLKSFATISTHQVIIHTMVIHGP